MTLRRSSGVLVFSIAALALLVSACAPAAPPAPTTAPAKPAEAKPAATTAPAKPAEAPAKPADKPAATPAAKAEAKPAEAKPAGPGVTLKLTTLDREDDVVSEPLKWWIKTVGERTGGRVQIQPFWSESLVPLPRTLSAVKSGVADVGYMVTALLSGEEKDFSILEVAGAIPTDQRYLQAAQAIKPVMTTILDRQGVVEMWPRRSPNTPIACKHKLLTQASDYNGLKVRAAGRWQVAFVDRLGASAFPIPPAETYTALQRGTVDCTLHIYTLIWSLKFYEVAPFVTRLDYATSYNFIGASKEKWNQIAEADRQIIQEVSRDAAQREVDVLKQREESLIGDLEKLGVKFSTPAPAERQRIAGVIRPIWQEVRAAMGPDGNKLADLLEPFQSPG